MKFKDYLTEQELFTESEMNELFGFSKAEKEEKEAIKAAFNALDRHFGFNQIWDTLGRLSKAGNKLADKLLRTLSVGDTKSAMKLHKTITKG